MSSYTPPFVMTNEITSQVIEIAELIGELSVSPGLSPNPKLRRQNRIRSIYSSLAIEQNTLSLDQVTAIIEGRRVLGPPRDIQEVKNAFDAYEKASTLNPESQEDLLLAHRLIMTNLIPDAGCYRSGNVGVFNGGQLIHAGTPAAYVPEVMQQLFDWLRSTSLHPLISGCIFHYEFEFIHPFSDGNGRTGRLWHSLILQKWKPLFAWLPIETLIHEHQGEYYHVLNSADAQGNCSGFVSFMLRIIRDALLEVQQIDHRHVGDHVGNDVGDHVGKNEEAILLILRKQPKSTAKAMAELTHLSLRQVERILASLRDHGKIRRIGSARSGSWEILDYGNAD